MNGGDRRSTPTSMGLWNSAHCGNTDCGPATAPTEAEVEAKATIAANWEATGLTHALSEVRGAHVRDGKSDTLLISEKYLNPDSYENGRDSGDNENMYIGDNGDTTRWTSSLPLRDTPGVASSSLFGSAHTPGFNAVFCDGSVHLIGYKIDADVFKDLGNRADGRTIEPEELQ